jgi:ribosomal protein S1
MKIKGEVVEYFQNKGGYGRITSIEEETILFEQCECDYEFIRIGDTVMFDLIKTSNGELNALDIELLYNTNLIELESYFETQQLLECYIEFETPKGFVVSYKNINMFLPSDEKQKIIISKNKNVNVYINAIHYGNKFIVALDKNNRTITANEFSKHVNEDSFEFEIIELNSFGALLARGEHIGFLPNSHTIPLDREKIELGQKIFVKILSCSKTKGLTLSARNHY